MKVILSVMILSGFFFASPMLTNAIKFRIDTNHSNIGFAVPIAGGLSEVHGKFSKFRMDLVYNEDDITKSKVNVVIDASSIDTGIDGRDRHLQTADFFDVANHPNITFKSKRIIKEGEKLTLIGDFSMRGVTKEISFPFSIKGKELNKTKTHVTMGFFATLKIDRTEYGVNYQHKSVPNFIGNEVEVRLNIMTRSARVQK